MSLISEALKRHERNDDDDNDKDKPATPAAPAAPATPAASAAPSAPAAPKPEVAAASEGDAAPKRKLKLTKLKKAAETQPSEAGQAEASKPPSPAPPKAEGTPIRLAKKKPEAEKRPEVELPGPATTAPAPAAAPPAAPIPPPPPSAPPPPPSAPPPPPTSPPAFATPASPAPAKTAVEAAPEAPPAKKAKKTKVASATKKVKAPKAQKDKSADSPRSTPVTGIIIGVVLLLLVGGGAFVAMQLFSGSSNGNGEDPGSNNIPGLTTNDTGPATNLVVQPSTNAAPLQVETNQVAEVPTNAVPIEEIAITRRARVLSPHDIDAIAVHPRSQTVATLAGSSDIHFWNAEDGSSREQLKGKEVQADTVLFDNSGRHLILNRAKFRVLDITTRNVIQSHDWLSPRGTFEALAVSLNGEFSASGATSGKSCLIWSLVDGRLENEIALLEGTGINHISLAPDGRHVAIVDNRDTLQIYDVNSGKRLKSIDNNMITRSAFSSNGRNLAYTFESVEQATSSGIVVLETVGWETEKSIDTEQTLLEGLSYVGSKDQLISVTREGIVTIWNPGNGHRLAEMESGDGWTFALAVSADAQTLVTATRDKVFNIWDLSGFTAAPIRIPRLAVSHAAVKPPPGGTDPNTAPTTKPKEPAQWPALKCEGFMGSGAKGSVLINGRIITVGGKIEGATVTAITGQSVELNYKGELRRLKVGNSTR